MRDDANLTLFVRNLKFEYFNNSKNISSNFNYVILKVPETEQNNILRETCSVSIWNSTICIATEYFDVSMKKK